MRGGPLSGLAWPSTARAPSGGHHEPARRDARSGRTGHGGRPRDEHLRRRRAAPTSGGGLVMGSLAGPSAIEGSGDALPLRRIHRAHLGKYLVSPSQTLGDAGSMGQSPGDRGALLVGLVPNTGRDIGRDGPAHDVHGRSRETSHYSTNAVPHTCPIGRRGAVNDGHSPVDRRECAGGRVGQLSDALHRTSSKLVVRVRFSSPAPRRRPRSTGISRTWAAVVSAPLTGRVPDPCQLPCRWPRLSAPPRGTTRSTRPTPAVPRGRRGRVPTGTPARPRGASPARAPRPPPRLLSKRRAPGRRRALPCRHSAAGR
jgi:hypothetical protein